MDATRKHELLAQAKSNRVSNIPIVESETEPNTTHCIWLKQGIMYAFENGQWEAITGEGGSGGGGGVIKLPVKFNTIETTGGGEDPDDPIVSSVNPTRGDTKGPTVYYCKQKVSGDLFGPTENGVILDLAYYFDGGDPKGSDMKATKSDLDDVFHQYYTLGRELSAPSLEFSQMLLQGLGLTDDASAKVLVSWGTTDSESQSGPNVASLIYKGSNYLYIIGVGNSVLSYYYNNPDFRGITITEAQEQPIPGPQLG